MENTKLYDGKIDLYFDEDKHVYSLDERQEKVVPGVTSITHMVAKPQLVPWAVNCAIEFYKSAPNVHDTVEGRIDIIQGLRSAHRLQSSRAATNGTKAHKWIEHYIIGKEQKLPDNHEIIASCFAFLNWVREAEPKFIMSERKIYSKKYGYAGTLDFTAEFDAVTATNGKVLMPTNTKDKPKILVLGDFKTSKAIYPEYFMETAARIKALEEEFPDTKYDAMMIVRVGKDGKHEVKIETNIDKYFEAFLGAFALYKCFKMV